MSNGFGQEIEREVRASRAAVEEVLDEIQRRLSPGQMVDEALDYLQGSGGDEVLRNLGAAVRENPVPAVLLATSLAWLMLSGHRSNEDAGAYEELGDDNEEHYGADAGSPAEQARERARRVSTRARERVSKTVGSAPRAAHGAERSGPYGRRVQRGFMSTLREQPLVLGAIGLAIGVALGAALPPSETEDEVMGEGRDKALRRATRVGRAQAEKARAAAGAVANAAREEARKQEAMPESSGEPSGATSSQPTREGTRGSGLV